MHKTALTALILISLLSLTFFTTLAMGADGDIYYFTDTDVSWETSQFSIIITVFIFMFFFGVGYYTPKRSGGGLMIFSAFVLFSLEALLVPLLSAVLVIPLISPVAIFILLLGIKKQFYPMDENTKKED